jgi:hypothetical protein
VLAVAFHEPGLVLRMGVRPRRLVDAEPVVNMMPMLWCRTGGIDAQRLDNLDGMKYLLDLRPTRQVEQDLATWLHERNR